MEEEREKRIVDCGDRLLIVTRRLFSGDVPLHFVGIVDRATQNAILIHGYAFVLDDGKFVRCGGQRSRVFSLDNQVILSVLPDDVDVSRVRYEYGENGQVFVTDGRQFRIDVRECGYEAGGVSIMSE